MAKEAVDADRRKRTEGVVEEDESERAYDRVAATAPATGDQGRRTNSNSSVALTHAHKAQSLAAGASELRTKRVHPRDSDREIA